MAVLEYLEFTQLSNRDGAVVGTVDVLEYLEFTQLSNNWPNQLFVCSGFRVPGIYTALKLSL